MKRIKIEIAYDGTNYCGWQHQPNKPTIEGICKVTIESVFKEKIKLIGASRTDSGVHALGNVAVFDTSSVIPVEKMRFAINQALPDDIRIETLEEVFAGFHPRGFESKKTYEYRIMSRRVSIPTRRLYTHFIHMQLDINRMKEAIKYLCGKQDFKGLSSKKTTVESTIRTIYKAEIVEENNEIVIKLEGDGFLYNMVRIIAGTLIEIGKGSYPPDMIKTIIENEDRELAGPTAPACGLTLVKIEY